MAMYSVRVVLTNGSVVKFRTSNFEITNDGIVWQKHPRRRNLMTLGGGTNNVAAVTFRKLWLKFF